MSEDDCMEHTTVSAEMDGEGRSEPRLGGGGPRDAEGAADATPMQAQLVDESLNGRGGESSRGNASMPPPPSSQPIEGSLSEANQYNTPQNTNADAVGKAGGEVVGVGGDDAGGDNEDGFVAIELTSSKHSNSDQPPPTAACDADISDTEYVRTSEPEKMPQMGTNPNDNIGRLPLPPRRRMLRHPILTPLAKLPWDRFIAAAGSCDVLFNCKYSMRQVEDEVREEHSGAAQDRVGRGGGYAHVSLGNEYGNYQYREEEGSEDGELAQMGLHCCSMLDDETDDDGEGVAPGELPKQPQEDLTSPGDGPHDRESVLRDKQKEEISWKQSNPSLDMMLYRTMIHE